MILNLDHEFKKFLKILYDLACSRSIRLFIVGGAVRDYFLNIKVKDFDLILEGNAIEFSSYLPPEITVKSIHKDFGTVKLKYGNLEFDLASTRCEKYPYSGCLPVVDKIGVPVDIDVKRRDFTLNSMYFEVLGDEFKLVDLANGLNDLNSKKLKVLHTKSYIDDPTRIFRGLAFKYRFGFDFSNDDKKLIADYLSKIDYSNMSSDRNLSVFKKSLECPFGLVLFKEIISEKIYKILTAAEISVDFSLIETIIEKFELSYADFSSLCEKIVMEYAIEEVDLSDILSTYKTLIKLKKSSLAYLYYKTKNQNILNFLKVKDIKLNISGADLLKSGYKEGKLIGEILDKALRYKLNHPEKQLNYNDELELVKSLYPLK